MDTTVSTERFAQDVLRQNWSEHGQQVSLWAAEIVDDVIENVQDVGVADTEDRLFEIVDAAVPVYDADVLALIDDSYTLCTTTPQWVDPGPGATVIGVARAVLVDLAYDVAGQALQWVQDEPSILNEDA